MKVVHSKKWHRVKNMIRKILGKRLVNGKYRIVDTWSGHYDQKRIPIKA